MNADRYEKENELPPESDAGFAQYLRKQHVQIPDNLRVLKRLNGYLPNRGKLLEVGSWMGIFANEIRSTGWDVTCIEPYVAAVRYSREKFKLNVIQGVLPQPA